MARDPASPDANAAELGPWNPGVQSRLPSRLLALSTIFRPENVFADLSRIKELRELTGLDFNELVSFRPQRLALHELLIRVTADLSVSDGSRYEDLGINFRAVVSRIYSGYVQPELESIEAAYATARERLGALIAGELRALAGKAAEPAPPRRGQGLRSMLGLGRPKSVAVAAPELEDLQTALPRAADDYEERIKACDDPAQAAALRALARVLRVLYGKVSHWATASELINTVALDLACNSYCAAQIGQLVDEHVKRAAQREGYRFLPPRDPAIVMNTKGPSASGKSTLRPLQHALADRLGADWSEFALISPDIWRKQLLDYSTLGPDHRYGGMLTSEELSIIDRKLDRYVEHKAEQGRISHLLIDRFRFGSFVVHGDRADNRLLSRFGHEIYFFFMITPPAALVERAWKRGLEYGRYKAVDDLLAHSIEAYAGMPQLFLTWAGRTDKAVHFEFLDNSVELGHAPRTVAFGWNGQLVVLDPGCLLDVVRYRRVNVDARSPDELFRDVSESSLAPQNNLEFLLACVRQLREVIFAEQASGRVYLRFGEGRPVWDDPAALADAAADQQTRAVLTAVTPGLLGRVAPRQTAPLYVTDILDAGRMRTLGDWAHATDRIRA